ncbi:MAG: hypothetical protein GXO84_06855 [Chlorobi bacterium]|nr:hypothetical protein [Chlorobiota bacterium]
MQLYKSRDFSAFFQDTFAFLKQNGKHYFKHYFIVNGIFLLILMVLGYFFTKFYSELLFGGILQNNPNAMDDYMNDNLGLFVLLLFVFLTVGLIAGLISYSYTAIYLKLYIKNNGSNFDTKAIIESYKANIGKLFIFLLCGLLIAFPILIVSGIVMFVLAITIIGFLLLPLVIGALSLFYNMTLMEYIENKKGIWDSFRYAWTLLTSKFWAAVGSVGLFFLMSYIVQNVITIIPYIFGMASIFTTIDSGSTTSQDIGGTMMIIMLIVFFITFIVGSILNNIIQLNQGIVFYSLKEDQENINTKSIIDQIGSGE